MIEIRNLSFAYADGPALRDLSLTVERGASLALLGANGSGKSTLLRLLNGLVFADEGSYLFDGEAITRKSLADRAFSRRFHQRVGFLFQNSDAQLFCTSVRDEVSFGPRQMGLDETEVAQRVDSLLDLLGIAPLARRVPYHLSGGEKRKVALASVLALNPEVLVLDEPMNGLDPRTKRFLRGFLAELRDSGKTIICATHDFEYVDGLFRTAAVFSSDHGIARTGPYAGIVGDRAFLEGENII